MIGIIDVGVGNIVSVKNWLDRCIASWEIVNNTKNLNSYSLIILPGVGSAKLFALNLKKYGLFEELKKANERGQRILGICLGAQIFMDYLEEDGGVEGLGFIKGKVVKLNLKESNTCWVPFSFNKNNLSKDWLKKSETTSRKTKLSGRVFYNHNYGITTIDNSAFYQKIELDSLSSFSSIIHKKNIVGFQFHPEKSQKLGEELFKIIL
tara:strand:+ start:200 stop:823 length:624 start_codon:yes stop_codon:yes gene_type:complete